MTWILGEPTCCTTLPNACSYEEFDGCNGRWIHSCTEQSWGGDKKWTEGALFACVLWVYSYDLTLQYVVNYSIPHPLCICYENIEAPWCYQMCCLYKLTDSMLQVIPFLEVTTQSLNILKNTLYTIASYKMLDPFNQFSLFSKKFQGT